MKDDNWREEYKSMKLLSKYQVELLENGAKSLAQSWMLGVMYSDWKKKKGYKEKPRPDLSSSFKEFARRFLPVLLLLLPIPVQSRLNKQEYCDGYSNIEMRVCADIRLINQKYALQRKLNSRTFRRWDALTGELCQQSYKPYKKGTIYPLMISRCNAELNEVLLDHLDGLGENK